MNLFFDLNLILTLFFSSFVFADVDDLMPWSHPSPFLEASVATNSSAQTRNIKQRKFVLFFFFLMDSFLFAARSSVTRNWILLFLFLFLFFGCFCFSRFCFLVFVVFVFGFWFFSGFNFCVIVFCSAIGGKQQSAKSRFRQNFVFLRFEKILFHFFFLCFIFVLFLGLSINEILSARKDLNSSYSAAAPAPSFGYMSPVPANQLPAFGAYSAPSPGSSAAAQMSFNSYSSPMVAAAAAAAANAECKKEGEFYLERCWLTVLVVKSMSKSYHDPVPFQYHSIPKEGKKKKGNKRSFF